MRPMVILPRPDWFSESHRRRVALSCCDLFWGSINSIPEYSKPMLQSKANNAAIHAVLLGELILVVVMAQNSRAIALFSRVSRFVICYPAPRSSTNLVCGVSFLMSTPNCSATIGNKSPSTSAFVVKSVFFVAITEPTEDLTKSPTVV